MLPISSLQVVNKDPRTIQRWGWKRAGRRVDLAGLILYPGAPPRTGMWLKVELLGHDWELLGGAVARVDPRERGNWLASHIRTEVETEVGPPYRLRVRFMREELPSAERPALEAGGGAAEGALLVLPEREPEVRPWVRRELR